MMQKYIANRYCCMNDVLYDYQSGFILMFEYDGTLHSECLVAF